MFQSLRCALGQHIWLPHWSPDIGFFRTCRWCPARESRNSNEQAPRERVGL